MFAVLISEKLVTLKELKEYYTYFEAFQMYDIIITDNYNKSVVNDNIMKENKVNG